MVVSDQESNFRAKWPAAQLWNDQQNDCSILFSEATLLWANKTEFGNLFICYMIM